jgi:hypothetical protein
LVLRKETDKIDKCLLSMPRFGGVCKTCESSLQLIVKGRELLFSESSLEAGSLRTVFCCVLPRRELKHVSASTAFFTVLCSCMCSMHPVFAISNLVLVSHSRVVCVVPEMRLVLILGFAIRIANCHLPLWQVLFGNICGSLGLSDHK